MSDADLGVQFPRSAEGRRSTSAVGRGVVADALRRPDPIGAASAEQETSWRTGYLSHFRRLVEAGLASPEVARTIARDGLASTYDRMVVATRDGDRPLSRWAADQGSPAAWSDRPLDSVPVVGTAEPETELSVPWQGQRLTGDRLLARLDTWATHGVLEPSAVDAVGKVAAHPEWLRLHGWTVAVLGAGAELGPTRALLRWGATVAAVDLPVAATWQRLATTARGTAGTVLLPVRRTTAANPGSAARTAGADLVREAPLVTRWLAGVPGRLVLGSYVYADGAQHVRVSVAADAVATGLREVRPDLALAFLATPTDVFAVPADAVRQATQRYAERSRRTRLLSRPLRTLTAGRVLRRPYVGEADPGLNDSLVPQQGPNYALAKRLQRWRALTARAEGTLVSMNVAPPTRTRSVVKNRALAAAYAGAHRFGVEVFEPATANTLMAALLVHDLHTGGGPGHPHPWQDEAYAAVHGGLWRSAYAPRSALGLAALLGYGASRG